LYSLSLNRGGSRLFASFYTMFSADSGLEESDASVSRSLHWQS
jgi:hypothetical protein